MPVRGVSAQQINKLANRAAAVLLAESGQSRGPAPRGWNARHMVVIKTGVAEHNVYISIMPPGLSGFMKGPGSRSAQSAQFTEAELRAEM